MDCVWGKSVPVLYHPREKEKVLVCAAGQAGHFTVILSPESCNKSENDPLTSYFLGLDLLPLGEKNIVGNLK